MSKNSKFSWVYIVVLTVLLAAGLFYGCGGGGGGGSSPPASTGTAVISAQLVDAKDDTLLTTTTGPKGGFDVRYSVDGTPLKATDTIKDGIISYTTTSLSVGTVVNVEVIPKDAGGNEDHNYLRNNLIVTINQAGANDYTNRKIRITNLGNLPNGVTAATGTTTSDTTGQVLTSLVITTPAGSAGAPTATVSIPAGTVLYDATGQPLTGTLTIRVVYYPSTSADALQSFPGGLNNIVQTNGVIGAFISAGFLSIDIVDSSGRIASGITFSSVPFEIITEIAPSTINPDTGSSVKVGDKIPFWSFDSRKGKWKHEGNKTVETGGSTGLRIRHNPNHLSYWNLDWFPSSTCTAKISFTGNTVPLKVIIKATGGYGFCAVFFQPAGDSNAVIWYVPSGIPFTVEAYADSNLVGSISTNNWCGEPKNTLNLAVTIPNPTNRTVTVKYVCPTNSSATAPAPGIAIRSCKKTGNGYKQCDDVGSTDANGVLNFNVTDTSKVTVAAYQSNLYEAVNNAISLPNTSVCPTTGSGGSGGTGGTGTGSNF